MMDVIFSHELNSQFRISFCLLPDSTWNQHFELAYYYPEPHIDHTPFSCVVLELVCISFQTSETNPFCCSDDMLLLNGPTTEDERGKKSDIILCITNKW